jgi:hypothetical protein
MDYDGLDPALRRFRELYRDDSRAWLERLPEPCAPDFQLHDPFGGRKLGERRFLVEDAASGQNGADARWTWVGRWKARSPQKRVPGVTWRSGGAGGKVVYHQGHVDAAQGFLDVVPLLGGALRAVEKRP